ncbi:hypothetical protein [Hymenobacter chitinivorans]|uniref:Uncharacterized protein n=1 Tax=Hymenobacter chitinivorans DSM 11115 TaxID=1121954 RepID=A0A2M9AQM3_9BACT|nr:hypothetical protein [Hymenobacter chitinivorans]PJJ48004.1 hypothetical protein CLV45_4695 [Hymenobacter chitinivorans DSM 11115]
MRHFLLVILLVLQLPARASQIAVGIWSKNFLAWDVWEQQPSRLMHQMLLYNKASHEVALEVRLLRFREVNTQFETVPTSKVLFRVKLQPGQLQQLKYPKQGTGHDYMEFFENGQRVGVQELNGTPPPAAAVQPDFRFYSASSANSGQLGYWLALESLYQQPGAARLALFIPKGYDEEYQLVRITAGQDTLGSHLPNLDSLRVIDASIIRLDNQNRRAVVPRPALPVSAAPALFTLETQYMSNSYYYDEQKVRHPRLESGGGARRFIPVFARP